MSCLCVKTAILKENENEKLRLKINRLEQKLKSCQTELLLVYTSNTSSYNSTPSNSQSSQTHSNMYYDSM